MTDRKTSDISVIIPTLNEEEHLDRLLANLAAYPDLEIIVVDGGSRDRTAALARSRAVILEESPPGRGRQLNRGVGCASREILLFLHSDTLLPCHFAAHIHATLGRPGTAAGAFRLTIDAPGAQYRLIEWGANLRSRFFKLPYGDQALFTRRKTLLDAGGVPEESFMEDITLVRRLKQAGTIRLAPAAVVTSARRWQRLGVLRTTLLNQVMLAGYLLNADRDLLRRLYYRYGGRRDRR